MGAEGFQGHIVYAAETTAFSRTAPSIPLPFISEGIEDRGSAPMPHPGIIKGRRISHGSSQAKTDIGGPIRVPLVANGIGTLLKCAVGGVSTTGAGPYVHVITPGSLTPVSIQKGWEGDDGTDYALDYIGALVDGFTIECSENADPTIQFDLRARSEEDDAYADVSPTFPTYNWFEFHQLTVDFGEGSTECFDSFSFTHSNNLRRLPGICPDAPRATKYSDSGMVEASGTLVKDFEDFTHFAKFQAGTQVTMQFLFNAGAAAQLQIDCTAVLSGETPKMSGRERLKQAVPFAVQNATNDASGLTYTLTNGDSSI